MIVKCSDCHASYSVDDSKVTNKKFGFSCPKCGTNVIIDNRSEVVEDAIYNAIESDLPDSTSGFEDSSMPSERTAAARSGSAEDTSLGDMPGESEISSILNEFEDDIKPSPAREKKTEPSRTDEFLDFDLSSDDEKILRGNDSGKMHAAATETTSAEDESITLEDFESTEGLELSLDDQPAGASSGDMDIRLDDMTDSELELQVASRPQTKAASAGSISPDSTHVSQDDFRPLEEDLVLDDMLISSPGQERPSAGIATEVKSEDILVGGSPEETDESITIDLDSLDIQLDEGAAEARSGETPPADDLMMEDISPRSSGPSRHTSGASVDDDQNVTLDLDSLDITLDEVEEFKEGITVDDEDERLTLDDAGITIDQLEAQKTEHARMDQENEAEEDLRLSIDDIDPTLRLEDIEKQHKSGGSLIADMSSEDLPEIDFDKLESGPESLSASSADGLDLSIGAAAAGITSASARKEDYLDIETRESYDRYRKDIEKHGSDQYDTVPRGAINFSIDYSLSHSRIGALLRLLGLYYFALIPHYITLFIYSVLSQILGLINWIIILFTGNYIEDFIEVQEKTLRYMLSLSACQTAAVEEMPVFAGKDDIDHALQFNVIYPSKPSRFLAFMRISFIGIYILLLPHIIILSLLSLGSFIITIIGLISILAIKRWPNILFEFMVRYFRYVANVLAFMIGLVDKYPTFRFE